MVNIVYSIAMMTQEGPEYVGTCTGVTLEDLAASFEYKVGALVDSAKFRSKEQFNDDRLSVISSTVIGERCKYILRKIGSEEFATVTFPENKVGW